MRCRVCLASFTVNASHMVHLVNPRMAPPIFECSSPVALGPLAKLGTTHVDVNTVTTAIARHLNTGITSISLGPCSRLRAAQWGDLRRMNDGCIAETFHRRFV